MKKRYFIAGTDTDVGKTYVSVGLLNAAARKGLRVLGLKPIAAGAELVDGSLKNEDALLLHGASNVKVSYEQVNPVVLEQAIAPHIAASLAGRLITASRLEGFLKGSLLMPHDFALVEGAGGWRVPLNDRESLSDLACALGFPVIMVVNMKLGCLNHAILTAEAIHRDGLNLVGWVANTPQETVMPYYQENLASLQAALSAPLLTELSWQPNDPQDAAFDALFETL